MKSHREKTAIHKPRREAWSRCFPYSPHKEPAMLMPWILEFETISFCFSSLPLCGMFYGNPSKLVQILN